MELKKLTRYFLALLLFSFIGCQEDDILMNEQPAEGSATITKISFSKIKNDPKHRRVAGTVNEFKESIKLKHSSTGRLVYNEEYGFYIDEENGIYIEDGEKHSYTFRIERPETGEKIENIVFAPDGNGAYKTMLVRYDIKNDEFYTLTEDEIKERESQLAVYDPTARDFSTVICTYTWKFVKAEKGEPGYNEDPSLAWGGEWVQVWDCDFIGGGGGGSWSGPGHGVGGNTGPGSGPGGPACCGGGSSGSSAPIVTAPVPKTPRSPYQIKLDPLLMHNYKCQSQIILDVHNACSGLNDTFKDIFEGLGTHNVTYFNSPNLPPSTNGRTVPVNIDPASNVYNFKIELRDAYLSTATDLSIARTVIHENLHALLLYFKHTNSIILNEDNPTYVQLLDAYIDKAIQLGSTPFIPTTGNIHHDFMAQFVGDIANTLKAYGVSKGYNLPDSYYNSMAWGGLTHIADAQNQPIFNPAFLAAVPNPQDQYDILVLIEAEATNQTVNNIVPTSKSNSCNP